MAISTAPRVAPRRAPGASARPRLAVVAAPSPRRSPLPFAVLCSLIVVATLAIVLFLNIQMSDTSYEITRLEAKSQKLTEQAQGLQEQEDQLSTPQELGKRAQDLGMVPAGSPSYIDLGSDSVVGEAQPVGSSSGAESSSIPEASIYEDSESYHGMGNEGN
jgi:TolA-binding protein